MHRLSAHNWGLIGFLSLMVVGVTIGIVFASIDADNTRNEIDDRKEYKHYIETECAFDESSMFYIENNIGYLEAVYGNSVSGKHNTTLIYPPIGRADTVQQINKWLLGLSSPTRCWLLPDTNGAFAITELPSYAYLKQHFDWLVVLLVFMSCGCLCFLACIRGLFLEKNEQQ